MIDENRLQQLKAADPDRYRAALFAPQPVRDALLLLYSFHLELSKVPELVSEPMIGEIRYQWWKDVIEEIYAGGSVRSHDVATPLAALIREQNLSRYGFDKLIRARMRDLDPTPFRDIAEARAYAASTSGGVMALALDICRSFAVDDTQVSNTSNLSRLGEAWGLTGLARAWRFYHNSMLKHLSFEAVCTAAALDKERVKIPVDAMPACAYVACIPGYLARLTHMSHKPKIDDVSYPAWRKQLRMIGASFSGKVN